MEENTTPQAEPTPVKTHHPNWGGARKGAGRKPKKIERRGGAREGSGRPPKGDEKLQQVALYVHPRTKRRCNALKEMGFNITAQFENRINELAELMNLDTED